RPLRELDGRRRVPPHDRRAGAVSAPGQLADIERAVRTTVDARGHRVRGRWIRDELHDLDTFACDLVDRVRGRIDDPIRRPAGEDSVGIRVRELPGHEVLVVTRPDEAARTDAGAEASLTTGRADHDPTDLIAGHRQKVRRRIRRQELRRPRDDAVNRVLTDRRNAVDAGRTRAIRRGDREQLGYNALHLVLADPHAADLAGKSGALLALRASAKAGRPAMPSLGHEQLAVTRKREVTRVVQARD